MSTEIATSPLPSFAARADRVFDWLDEFVDALPTPSSHRRILAMVVAGGRAQLAGWPTMPAPTLPLLVHAAAAGDEEPALPLAGACTLVYLGADLLDNLADRELPDAWRDVDPGQTTLAAATLLAAMPELALAKLAVAPERAAALHRMFGESLLAMSAGQHLDLAGSHDDADPLRAARLMVDAKAGAEFALFSGSAAVLAGASPEQVTAYTDLGHHLGCAAQFISDMSDVAAPDGSQDLLNGKPVLPVAHALASRSGEQLVRLRSLLDRARESVESHEEVRTVLAQAGSFIYTAVVISYHRRRALSLLDATAVESSSSDLRVFVDELTGLGQPAGGEARS